MVVEAAGVGGAASAFLVRVDRVVDFPTRRRCEGMPWAVESGANSSRTAQTVDATTGDG